MGPWRYKHLSAMVPNKNPEMARIKTQTKIVTATLFITSAITSAILPLTSEYSFSLVRVRDLGLELGLG